MKKQNTILLFLGGAILGISLTLCLGAAGKPDARKADESAEKSATPRDYSKITFLRYENGTTAIWDAESSRIYLYDANLVNCYAIREVKEWGQPMMRIKN